MGEITAMVIVATVAYTIYRLFELFARRKERMSIIDKIATGADMKVLQPQFVMPAQEERGSWAMRIGMLLIGIGFGVILATIVDLCMGPTLPAANDMYHYYRNTLDVLYPACAALFGGIGLIIAYFVENKTKRN